MIANSVDLFVLSQKVVDCFSRGVAINNAINKPILAYARSHD